VGEVEEGGVRGGSGGHGDGGGAGADAEAAEGEEGRHREAAREREIFRVGWVGRRSSDSSWKPGKVESSGEAGLNGQRRAETEKIADFLRDFGGLAESWARFLERPGVLVGLVSRPT